MITTDFSCLSILIEGDSDVVHQLKRLGRTEDLHMSPNGDRFAIAGYALNQIYVFEIDNSKTKVNQIHLRSYLSIQSPDLKNPHGIFWLDDLTIAVANREHATCIFSLPVRNINSIEYITINPITKINCDSIDHLNKSSCICADVSSTGIHELFICSNYSHYVTHHLLDTNFSVIGSATLLKKGLNVPDGAAISANKKWLAISNHDDHTVYVYENRVNLNPRSPPNAILHGVSYAHGIKFYSGDQYLFVTDAGSPFVFVFFNPSNQWNGEYYPCLKMKIMNEKLFNQCHSSPEEGGNKGLYIDEKRGLLMISCEQIPLACFDINAILGYLPNQKEISDLTFDGLNDQGKLTRLVKNMRLGELKNNIYFSEEMNKLQSSIKNLLKSKSWKITYPLRYISYHLKKIFM